MKRTVRGLGNTRSGVPGNRLSCRIKRSPLRCRKRRTTISGFVFFFLTEAIMWLRCAWGMLRMQCRRAGACRCLRRLRSRQRSNDSPRQLHFEDDWEWTDTDRIGCHQAGDCLSSDKSDAEWDCSAALIPPAKPGGWPRLTDMRSAMNAIFYLLLIGCPCAICRAGCSRRARRSTTSSASSSGRACGRRSGRTCARRCANGWGGRRALSEGIIDSQFAQAGRKGDARKMKQTQWVMTPYRRRGARSTLWSIPKACPCGWRFTPPPFRTGRAAGV